MAVTDPFPQLILLIGSLFSLHKGALQYIAVFVISWNVRAKAPSRFVIGLIWYHVGGSNAAPCASVAFCN